MHNWTTQHNIPTPPTHQAPTPRRRKLTPRGFMVMIVGLILALAFSLLLFTLVSHSNQSQQSSAQTSSSPTTIDLGNTATPGSTATTGTVVVIGTTPTAVASSPTPVVTTQPTQMPSPTPPPFPTVGGTPIAISDILWSSGVNGQNWNNWQLGNGWSVGSDVFMGQQMNVLNSDGSESSAIGPTLAGNVSDYESDLWAKVSNSRPCLDLGQLLMTQNGGYKLVACDGLLTIRKLDGNNNVLTVLVQLNFVAPSGTHLYRFWHKGTSLCVQVDTMQSPACGNDGDSAFKTNGQLGFHTSTVDTTDSSVEMFLLVVRKI